MAHERRVSEHHPKCRDKPDQRRELSYTEILVFPKDDKPGNEEWLHTCDDEYIHPVRYCPYCGLDINGNPGIKPMTMPLTIMIDALKPIGDDQGRMETKEHALLQNLMNQLWDAGFRPFAGMPGNERIAGARSTK